MPIYKAKSDAKQRIKQQERELLLVSDEAQNRLAEILADSPSIERLAGTEWEMRPLRMGTQYLIVKEVCDINKADSATYGDVLKALLLVSVVRLHCLSLEIRLSARILPLHLHLRL